jgi:penicillin-binding protein 2
MSENQPEVEPKPGLNSWRMIIFYGTIVTVMVYYVFRLFTLQIVSGQDYQTRAEDNRTLEVSQPTQRGLIYDRNGYVLARNVPSYNLTITPANLPEDEGAIQEIYRQLSQLIDIPVSSGEINEETVRNFTPCQTDLGISQIVFIAESLAPYNPVRVKCNIDEKIAKVITEKSNDLPGVAIEVESIRDYPTGSTTAQVVGFLGPIPAIEQEYWQNLGFIPNRDKVGYAGVENSLNDILIGKNGQPVELEIKVG